MRNVQIVPIQKISPYVRYVNEVRFPGGHRVAMRELYDCELIFCLSGEAVMEYGGETYRMERGSLFYLQPGVLNEMTIPPEGSFHGHCVHFDWMLPDEQFNFTVEQVYMQLPRGGREMLERLRERPAYVVPAFSLPPLTADLQYEELAPLFRRLYEAFCMPGACAQLKTRAVFLTLAAEILSELEAGNSSRRVQYHQKTVGRAVRYLREHLREGVTTPLLAAQAGLSPKYFGVLFKSVTGMAVHEYLVELRLQEAKRLLLHTRNTLPQIAEKSGICDAAYFTRLFKRHEGITPGKYRKMLADALLPAERGIEEQS